jgi:type II secretory ATPase GspE/PulE/Tfp pilus assembly ATPase PilB-like protein
MNSPIKKQLIKSADSMVLQEVALSCGMQSLRQDGGYLVAQGITSSVEVMRVTRSCEE